MLGHFLGTLTTEQEDRVLTHVLQPGPYCGGCLIGTVHGIPGMDSAAPDYVLSEARAVQWQLLHDPILPVGQWEGYRRWQGSRLGNRYDHACTRFGAPRVNNAIRARILSNRLWRTLKTAPVSREAAVSVSGILAPQTCLTKSCFPY